MGKKSAFRGKVFVIGFGSVSRCTIPLLLKLVEVLPSQITIVDEGKPTDQLRQLLQTGVHYIQIRVTAENYRQLLKEHLKAGDLVIDLACNIDTCAILDYCHNHGIHFLNTAVEQWSPYKAQAEGDLRKLTLYSRHRAIEKMISKWPTMGPTAIIDHGANPGLVSHFAKKAILEISEAFFTHRSFDERTGPLREAYQARSYAALCDLLGIKSIHISERDSQVTHQYKEIGEFVNTWSVEGFIEEGIAPVELGWGSHERRIPEEAVFHQEGPKNAICLAARGINTWVRSWVPSGEIKGMVIRHGEALSLSQFLSHHRKDGTFYRPTVHYAYCPCDSALISLHEFEMRQFEAPEKIRILSDEIAGGADELGCLLMGHDFRCWWIGSVLNINEVRRLTAGQNATTLQVAISLIAALDWLIANPQRGLCFPEVLDHERVLDFARPYLGEFISKPVHWSPLDRKNPFLDYFQTKKILPEDEWQFTTFLCHHPHLQEIN